MFIRRFFYVLRRPADEGGDLGGAPADMTPVESAPVVDTPTAPTSMLEAMSAALTPGEAGQPRDEFGRFAPKAAEQAPAAPTSTATAAPEAPKLPAEVKPESVEADPLAMPEGLGEKAQQRFQQLANTVKEQTAWRQEVEPQLNYVRETFQQNGIQQEQFELFSQFAGAFNRGDYQAATAILQEQMQALALMTGQQLSADPLTQHPDLRDAVDNLQLTEAHAIELARVRTQSQQQTQRTQQVQQVQQAQQQTQQAINSAQDSIDSFCKQMKTSDIDYAAIEPQLLQSIKEGLLEGIPPARWPSLIQHQYQMIKKVAGTSRTNVPATQTLRPSGTPSPSQKPRSMMEAMFNRT
jgi:hypothetical protein